MLRRGSKFAGQHAQLRYRPSVPRSGTLYSNTTGVSRRLFANAASPPPSGGGGGGVLGLLLGAAAIASGVTGYRYYTDPEFHLRVDELLASLPSVSSFPASSARKPAQESSSTKHEEEKELPTQVAEEEVIQEEALSAPSTTNAETVVIVPSAEEVQVPTESAHTEEKPQGELKEAAADLAPEEASDDQTIAQLAPDVEHSNKETDHSADAVVENSQKVEPVVEVEVKPSGPEMVEVKTSVDGSGIDDRAATSAVVILTTESLAAVDDLARLREATREDLQHAETQPEAQNKEETKEPRTDIVIDSATRLQELQAIKEIIAVQAESCERQVREKVERLRNKYEQKMLALRQHTEEIVAEQVDIERQKILEEFQHSYQSRLHSLQEEFEIEKQRLYADIEDLVSGLNTRFVELVQEEKQLLQNQLDESSQLHAQTLAYIKSLVDDAEYRSRNLWEERELWNWTEKLAASVTALEGAALGSDSHLKPFEDELALVQSLAGTRPVFKAVSKHIEAYAPRGVYSVGRLRERFEQVEKHVRVAAQVPEDGGLLSHALAPLRAAVASVNPYHEPTPQEQLLDRARRNLQADDLLAAVHEMERLTGLARELANDWLEEARKRLLVEQAVSLISADVATQRASTAL